MAYPPACRRWYSTARCIRGGRARTAIALTGARGAGFAVRRRTLGPPPSGLLRAISRRAVEAVVSGIHSRLRAACRCARAATKARARGSNQAFHGAAAADTRMDKFRRNRGVVLERDPIHRAERGKARSGI